MILHLKISCVKCRPFCPAEDELKGFFFIKHVKIVIILDDIGLSICVWSFNTTDSIVVSLPEQKTVHLSNEYMSCYWGASAVLLYRELVTTVYRAESLYQPTEYEFWNKRFCIFCLFDDDWNLFLSIRHQLLKLLRIVQAASPEI